MPGSKNSHRIIWAIAAVVVAASLAWQVWRERPPAHGLDMNDAVARAVALLVDDPSANLPATQAAVREAAVAVLAAEDASAEGAYALAVQYQREHNLSRAEAAFRRAIEKRPDWARPWAGLGNLLGRHSFGRQAEAEEALRQAIALEPQWGAPHNYLAILLRIQGRLEDAEKESLAALRLTPNDLAALNNHANLLVELERYEEAEDYYRAAIEVAPRHAKPYYNLACLYSMEGQEERALEYLSTAIGMAPVLKKDASTDPDLDNIRDLEAFQQLLRANADVDAALELTG